MTTRGRRAPIRRASAHAPGPASRGAPGRLCRAEHAPDRPLVCARSCDQPMARL